MRKRFILLLAMLMVLSVAVALPATAKEPLRGDMELYFNLGFGNPDAPCPDLSWAGTVELDGIIYGIAFFPTGAKDVGAVHHFEEIWEIYDAPFEFTGGVLAECVPGDIVLAGTDSGVTGPNSTYRMNGTVAEAFAPFSEWVGRNVHMSGDITWADMELPDGTIVVVPATAPGTFRIN
jgi:hypothetical protein